MNDLLFLIVQIFKSTKNLRDNELGLFFRDLFILFQIKIKVRTGAQLQDCAKAIVIDFDSIILFHYSPVIEVLVNFILS